MIRDETASGLGFNIPACSFRDCKRPPEVCDPQLHLSASELIRIMPRATKNDCHKTELYQSAGREKIESLKPKVLAALERYSVSDSREQQLNALSLSAIARSLIEALTY